MTAEIESKFALADGQSLPGLERLGDPGEVVELQLAATYFDSPHFVLTRAHQVVRHRVGGVDEGWHVKLPGNDAEHRHERQAPVDLPRPPEALRSLVAATLVDQPLIPVAQLSTQRRQTELRGPAGDVSALVCEDAVRVVVGGAVHAWREAEVELVNGPESLIDAVAGTFADAGIRPALLQSKIGRALQEAMAADDSAVRGPGGPAGSVVAEYLAVQVGTLQSKEADSRRDAPDSVHRSRVATRRLRSVLQTFAPLYTRAGVRALRTELRWHAGELGVPRDAEVLRDRLEEALDQAGIPEGEPGRELMLATLVATHAQAHAEMVATMNTPRYDELHRALASFLAEPPYRAKAARPAEEVLPPLLRRARDRVALARDVAVANPDDLHAWHECRKEAKAVRYACEALTPAFGPDARAHAKSWTRVTEAFGEVQDSAVACELLAGIAHQAAGAVATGSFEVLIAQERARASEALVRGRAALDDALAATEVLGGC